MAILETTCRTCKYAVHNDEPAPIVMCKRYPAPQSKSEDDWCGEHERRWTKPTKE